MTTWVSGRFSQLVPSRSTRYGIASKRSASTPTSNQWRITLTISSKTQRIVKIQVRLVGKEAVPVVGLGFGIPGPVGFLRVGEDDARVLIFLVRVAPHVKFPLGRTWRRSARPLKPRMLVRRVVDYQLDHHLQSALVSSRKESREIVHRSVHGVDAQVVGYVVAVVLERRGEEGQQPQACDAEVLKIVELLQQAAKISDPVAVAVFESAHVNLVDNASLYHSGSSALPGCRTVRTSFSGSGTMGILTFENHNA